MIWVKRLSPLVLITVLWFAYSTYDKYRTKKFAAEADHRALVTAQVWVASAEFRSDPAKYLAWRDSTLKANSLPPSEMGDYLRLLQGKSASRQEFASRINHYVDSLAALRDSLRRLEEKRLRDSAGAAYRDTLRAAAAKAK